MNAKECRAVRQQIDQSELGPRLGAETEAHLESCPGCANFRSERVRLRELVGSLRPVADFDVRLRARIARERDRQSAQPAIFRFVMGTPAIAFAAVVVMFVGAMLWISHRGVSPGPAAATHQPAAEKSSAPQVENSEQQTPVSVTPPAVVAVNQKGNSSRRPGARPLNGAPNGGASDFNVSRAETYRLEPNKAGEVSLTAPGKPVVVSMYDETGRSRRILLPPISFGSQRLMDTRTPVSMNNTRDW